MKTGSALPADAKAARDVDAYIKKHAQWGKQLSRFRDILASTELEEAIKWNAPAYTLNGKAVVSMVAFKQHCALWFHQGVFLQDKQKQLVNAQAGKTQAMRQWRFESSSKIDSKLVTAYVREAIANARAGKKLSPQTRQAEICAEFAQALKQDRALQQAYAALTPGRQREYAEHIAAAQQERTRLNRLQKAIPLIKAGIGLNDKYRNA